MTNGMEPWKPTAPGPMMSKPVISVIVPVHDDVRGLVRIRESVHSSATRAELIIVVNRPILVGQVSGEGPYEKVVVAPRIGRGFAFAEGAKVAEGEISLLLHSDTLLPDAWDSAVIKAMSDPGTAGGAFSRSFDEGSVYLRLLLPLGNLFSWFMGDIWGDRGMFLRTSVLGDCIPALDVPIMEDVRLGKCMRAHGKVRLIREKVVTSAQAFREHGMIRQTIRFLKCRIWYALGGNPDRIFAYYYSGR